MKADSPTRINGEITRGKILDAAEGLFGERGFDTVSLRDITDRAGVTLALASYHYRTKELLFAAVVARRAEVLCDLRRQRLQSLRSVGSVEEILDAFFAPLFDKTRSGRDGWPMYVRILASLGDDERWAHLLIIHFDDVAKEFLMALQNALPGVDRDVLHRAFVMILQLMLGTVARRKRLDGMTSGALRGDDLDSAYPVLLRFSTGGLLSLTRELPD